MDKKFLTKEMADNFYQKCLKNVYICLNFEDFSKFLLTSQHFSSLIHTYSIWELWTGMNVEFEHGSRFNETNVTNDDWNMTMKIAFAHLKEDKNYYYKLLKYIESGENE